jgi:hypothetical protein
MGYRHDAKNHLHTNDLYTIFITCQAMSALPERQASKERQTRKF